MKQLLLSATFIGSALMAQAQIGQLQNVTARPYEGFTPSVFGVTSGEDTLGWADFQQHNIYLYQAQTGFVFGTSLLVDNSQGFPITQMTTEVAGGFIVNGDYDVTGAMILAGAKAAVSAAPADAKVKLYTLADNKALSSATATAPDALGPDQMLASVNLPFADINLGVGGALAPTFVEFASPVNVTTDFGVSLYLKDNYGTEVDSLALFADEDGDSDGTMTWINLGFDIVPQTFWAQSRILTVDPLDVNVGIFPIVQDHVGVTENGFLNGMKLGQNSPNPAMGDITLSYELEKAAKAVKLQVYDASGRLAVEFNEGVRTQGRHSVTLRSGQLSAGTYFYGLRVGDKGIVRKMVVID